jgi:hypothetical protein
MRKSSVSTLIVLAAAVSVVSSATPALADDTWSVTGGGPITGSLKPGTNAVLRNTTTGQNITCSVATSDGSVSDGTGLSGTGIGSITAATFGTSSSKCNGPLFSKFTTTLKPGTTWSLNAVSYSGSVTTGTITGVDTLVTGSSFLGACNMEVSGEVDSVTYDNSTGELAISPDAVPNLTVSNLSGSGCGFIQNGDKSTMNATFVLSSTPQITSP